MSARLIAAQHRYANARHGDRHRAEAAVRAAMLDELRAAVRQRSAAKSTLQAAE